MVLCLIYIVGRLFLSKFEMLKIVKGLLNVVQTVVLRLVSLRTRLYGSSFGRMGKRSCSVLKSATHPAVLLVVSSAPPAPKGTCSAARPP